MKNSVVFKLSFIAVLLFFVGSVYGQKKYVESFDVSKDVVVKVNTSHTNVIFKTWNKNKVEVEAFIDDDSLSEKEKQEAFNDWNLDVLGNSNKIVITSGEGNYWRDMNLDLNLKELEDLNLNLEFIGPMLEELEIPNMNFEMPIIPEGLLEGISDLHFDYKKYQENEEEYMEQWNKQIENKFGDDFEEKMEAWGERFAEKWSEKKSDSLAKAINEKMMIWEEKHGKKMEEWAEQMEKKAEEYEKRTEKLEKRREKMEKEFDESNKKLRNVNRTIIIKMPKDTKTDINVRHGELKMADAFNVKAILNYSPFTAISIDGGNTLINASFAPVLVNEWKQGELVIKYVDQCEMVNVGELKLLANSCDVQIGNIEKIANLKGSYGMLNIENISDSFKVLDIDLVNTDAFIKIPTTEFLFNYEGTYSTFKIPNYLDLQSKENSERSINISAAYSNVTLH